MRTGSSSTRRAVVSITCISTAYQCFLRFKDKNRYTEMLKCMKDAWDGLNENMDTRLIKGMTEIFLRYKDIDIERMTKKLSMVRPSDIIRDAQADRTTGPRKYAIQILQRYNSGLRQDKKLIYNL